LIDSLSFVYIVKIPIIAVFTKYDVLVTQFWIQGSQPGKSEQERNDDAERSASDSFDSSVKELQEEWAIPCVKVSTTDHSAGRLFISPLRSLSINATRITETLIDLTNKTRSMLREVENKLHVLWVTAQQVNALQKVDVSIR
jgi:hypothetical protein